MTNSPILVMKDNLAVMMRGEWRSLVELACKLAKDPQSINDLALELSKSAGVGADGVKRKILAVQKMQALGNSADEIAEMGQERVLGTAQKETRAEKYTDSVWMKWKVKGSQREIVTQQIERVRQLLGLSAEGFWDWFYSQLSNLTDEEIKESDGEANGQEGR